MKVKCNKCYEGYVKRVDLNEGMANYEYLIPRYKFVCDNCEEEFQDIQIERTNDNIIKIKLISAEWEEHVDEYKYKTNFEPKENTLTYSILNNDIVGTTYTSDNVILKKMKEQYNLFPNKKFTEYIHKKELLERKLETFRYLNEDNCDVTLSWYIGARINCISNEVSFSVYSNLRSVSYLTYIGFGSKEIANAALDLYRDDIEEVLRLKKELYKC